MNLNSEIYRLIELMPASGRMFTKIVSKPEQSVAIAAQFPLPWTQTRLITIHFDLWSQLSQPQRDLLLLRTVSWLAAVQWTKPDLPKRWVGAGAAVVLVEVLRVDAVGIAVTMAGLAALAGTQIWRKSRSHQVELEVDEKAVRIAQRRGYGEAEAAYHLAEAIAAVAQIEGRPSLNIAELVRCQNLRAIAGHTPIDVSEARR